MFVPIQDQWIKQDRIVWVQQGIGHMLEREKTPVLHIIIFWK